MKINRRGFVAMAALITNQAVGQSSFFSVLSPPIDDVSKLKKIFDLKKYFFQKELKAVFSEKLESFQKLGYKSSMNGCLMNDTQTYAICPVELLASNKVVEQSFMLFSKDSEWSYVGIWNKYEMGSFLDFVEKGNHNTQFVSQLLPTKRTVDGVSNPYWNDKHAYSFLTHVKEDKVVCKIKLENTKFENHQKFEKTFKI
jgi:hypothetical protein